MKKILAMALSIALVATMAITGSVAYFTDTDDDVNVFTVGNVIIDQREWERKDQDSGDKGVNEFYQNKPLYPVYGDDDGQDEDAFTTQTGHNISMPKESKLQNYVDKMVDVENLGKSDAYVRTIFAVPTAGAGENTWLHLDRNLNGAAGWDWSVAPNDGDHFDDPYLYGTVTIEGKEYYLYVATYTNVLYGTESKTADSTKNVYSAPSLLGVYMDSMVDFVAERDDNGNVQYDDNGKVIGKYVLRNGTAETELVGDLDGAQILVATQAVQVAGFQDSATTDAEAAYIALDEAFGEISTLKHPWVEELDWEKEDPENPGEKIYEINTVQELFAFANEVNSGNGFRGATVNLTSDINLGGMEWTPIGQTGGYYADTYFQGTFDGGNHTIKNLKVTKWEAGNDSGANYASGLFGFIDCGTSGTIKNLTIDGAEVNGHHWTGAIAGYLSGKMENCTVKNAKIVCTHANDDACGDKAGAVVGYINGTQGAMTNCKAENSSVTAGRDAGQVVGAAKASQVSGCSAKNVTVTAIGDCTGANITNDVIGRKLT
ncbi:MAG: hypothetical protein IJ466_06835 [Clostridia bacterium]|nr:hypothetical protein [Clostridia bacterium]